MTIRAVTFDFGQTLTELDCELLSHRLHKEYPQEDQRILIPADALYRALPLAWINYDKACTVGGGDHPWHLLMHTLLEETGVSHSQAEPLVEWLWQQQSILNLWRRPIPGMIEIVRALSRTDLRVGVISNSEGKLATLADELGWSKDFEVIADSGLLGVAKPSPDIFRWCAKQLDVATEEILHIGDSWAADIEGITNVGGIGIWFGGASIAPTPPANACEGPRQKLCYSAEALESLLHDMQLLPRDNKDRR